MVSAVVLLNVEPGQVNEVGARLAELNGISEVFSVGGRFDLVAIIRVKDNDRMAQLVTEQMHSVPGITNSETLIAFRVFSEHDLAAMFSIGLES
jgi:DNA-binding Lrp family transcriptional regulator